MIISTLKTTNSVLLSSVQASNDKQAADNYMKQLALLNTTANELKNLLSIIAAISDKGIAIGIISSDTKSSVELAVNNCGEKTYDHSLDVSTVTSLKNAVAILKNELNSSWKEVARNDCMPIIESLTSLKGLLDNKKDVEALLDYYDRIIQNVPASSNALDTYIINLDVGRKMINDLNFSSDAEVQIFIRKVSKMNATVRDLSPHILDWLKDNNLTGKIKLRF